MGGNGTNGGLLQNSRETNPLFEGMIVFILLHFLGFPGNFTYVLGGMSHTLIDYGCFAMQIALILLSSGDSYQDIKLLDLKPQYRSIYAFVVIVIAEAMIVVSGQRSQELITCLRLVVTVGFGLWLSERYSPEKVLEFYYRAQILFVIFTILFTVAYRDIAFSRNHSGALMGLFGSKNDSAGELSFGMLAQLTLLRLYRDRDRLVTLPFLVMLLVQFLLLMLTDGTGALICAIVPAVYIWFFEPRWGEEKRLPLGYFYVVATVGFVLAALTVLPTLKPLFDLIGKDVTLTGRVPIWNHLIEIMTYSHTLMGFGYEWFWKDAAALKLFHAGFSEYSWFARMTTGSHNTMMELWINTGVIGIGTYFLMCLDSLRNTRWLPEDQYVFCSALLISFTMSGWTERSMAPAMNYTLVLFIILGYAARAVRPKKESVKKHGPTG